MANFDGELHAIPDTLAGTLGGEAAAHTIPDTLAGTLGGEGNVHTAGGGGAVVTYMNRARDSGAPPGPAVYVTWTTLDNTTGAYPGVPPYGGPLVDRVFWVLG